MSTPKTDKRNFHNGRVQIVDSSNEQLIYGMLKNGKDPFTLPIDGFTDAELQEIIGPLVKARLSRHRVYGVKVRLSAPEDGSLELTLTKPVIKASDAVTIRSILAEDDFSEYGIKPELKTSTDSKIVVRYNITEDGVEPVATDSKIVV